MDVDDRPETNGRPARPDSAMDRLWHGRPRVPRTGDDGLRRRQGRELLVVLLLFPLGSAFAAVADLILRLEVGRNVMGRSVILSTSPWMASALEAISRLIGLAPVVLVGYLLGLSGERFASLGLDRRRLRLDLALVLPIFLVVMWIPMGLGSHIMVWLDLKHFALFDPLLRYPAQFTVANSFAGLAAGILEEVVVLGYLVRRLEQRGMSATGIVAIAVAVRVSYHLYYGWGVVPIVLWALVTVLLYRRVRRLLPFILCHIAWDVAIPIRVFYPTFYRQAWWVAIVVTGAMLLLWRRWDPDRDLPPPTSVAVPAPA